MTTASPQQVRCPAPGFDGVRTAGPADAAALYALSEPFMRSGALRRRSPGLYGATAAQFFVAEDAEGVMEGCVALRLHPGDVRAGGVHADGVHAGDGVPGTLPAVLHNFCVRPDRQRRGVGSRLLAALLADAAARSVTEVFAATTGGGESFVRAGFRETEAARAPRAWAAALDPARGSRIFSRPVALASQPRPDRHCRASIQTR
ncbi:GNAT family N-acetyltransferase [Streptomyces luteireticuli]|uniref:GNAT family N-acetyltransferase n=1 Tax=Streptomyces luteireticuli TaxID=173858 RepID=UPI00355823F1